MEEEKVSLLRCKASTDANKLAGSIHSAHQLDPDSKIALRVIGAGALNQAIKAVIISNKFFAKKGVSVGVQPSFQDADGEMTAIEMRLIFIRH
jgi:stage V sporulation protein S